VSVDSWSHFFPLKHGQTDKLSYAADRPTHATIENSTKMKVALWRNGRALDLRSKGRGFDSRVGAQLRNDYGQVAHIRLHRRRQSSLLYGVVKPRVPLSFHQNTYIDAMIGHKSVHSGSGRLKRFFQRDAVLMQALSVVRARARVCVCVCVCFCVCHTPVLYRNDCTY